MTDARNGNWHRQAGTDCPVDPRDSVIVCHLGEGYPITSAEPVIAGEVSWSSVLAFRVALQHREPRVFWIAAGQAFDHEAAAEETGLPVIEAVERIPGA